MPPYIVGATLEISLRAHQGGSGNDRISLEFLNPNFRWLSNISALTPSGPWTTGTSKTLFLNLDSLPPYGAVTSVIADMSDGDLDVFVQDDTAVDYMILKLKVCCDEGIPGDIDNNGYVDINDFVIGAANFMTGVQPTP